MLRRPVELGQYACDDYRALLVAHGLVASMSRAGDCWDNAVAESFFATLKGDLVIDADWHTRAEATAALLEYIEVWYNRLRYLAIPLRYCFTSNRCSLAGILSGRYDASMKAGIKQLSSPPMMI